VKPINPGENVIDKRSDRRGSQSLLLVPTRVQADVVQAIGTLLNDVK